MSTMMLPAYALPIICLATMYADSHNYIDTKGVEQQYGH